MAFSLSGARSGFVEPTGRSSDHVASVGNVIVQPTYARLVQVLSCAAVLTLVACDAATVTQAPVHAADSVNPTSSMPVSASQQDDNGPLPDPVTSSNLQCDASCPVECAIQSRSDCLPPTEVMTLADETGVNQSFAPPAVLVSREHLVEAQRTPLLGSEAAKRLERAFRREMGYLPDPETLMLLTAHWAHETNHGTAMYNYNFGGIKGVGPSGAYAIHRTREGAGLQERPRTLRFRAYTSATQGAVDYLSLLNRLYGTALEAAARGDATGFVQGLKQGGYFSGDERIYLQKVTAFVELAQTWGFDALGPSGISPKHRASREQG